MFLIQLQDYLRRKSLTAEQKLRSAWAQINEDRKERETDIESQST